MLGCGASEKRDGQIVDESCQSDLLAALIAHWELDAPTVIAHDFGGLAALRAHFLNDVDYGRLILIDAVGVLPSGSPFYAHVARHEEAFANVPDYVHEALFRAYVQKATHYPLREEAMQIYLQPWTGQAGKAAFYRQIGQSSDTNIAEVEQKYKPPGFDVDVIWGRHDTFIPLDQARQLEKMLGAKSFQVIENAAHIVHEDAPEALVGALSTLLYS